jgi:16S rRNA (cytosine1402-N4)-methyltransferase
MKEELHKRGIERVDGIMLDLGVSSPQFDDPSRGFSYRFDARLDMRMDLQQEKDAYQVVNGYELGDLIRILKDYGEERYAPGIARAIVREREKAPIETTFQLVDVIRSALPEKELRKKGHPAKQTFQALRIEVNDELGALAKGLDDALHLLAPGGRCAVITFHSLEDRIVKNEFDRRLDPCTCPKEFPVCVCGKVADVKKVTRKPVTPSEEELELNPRARSAKLRVIEKL